MTCIMAVGIGGNIIYLHFNLNLIVTMCTEATGDSIAIWFEQSMAIRIDRPVYDVSLYKDVRITVIQ